MAEPDFKAANTAARDRGTLAEGRDPSKGISAGGDPSRDPGGRRGLGAARMATLCLAAVLIALSAWSMSQYAQGKDPLAPLSGSASTQAAVDAAPSADDDGSRCAIGRDDVLAALGDLSCDGEDVSLSQDVQVVVNSAGVWVEQRDGSEPVARVDATARRTAALARWIDGRGIAATVTWISEDESGVVRVVMSFDSSSAAALASDAATADVMAAASGYAIDSECFAALGDVSFSAAKGDAPRLPSGDEVAVGRASSVSAGSEGGSAQAVASGSGAASAGVSSTSGADGPAAAAERGNMTVSVSINGASHRVSVPKGASAYAALLATGATVEGGANRTGSGTWVTAINGLGQDSAHGLTYTVNGTLPSVMSDEYVLHDGDSVAWNYV